MIRSVLAATMFALLVACQQSAPSPSAGRKSACQTIEFNGSQFTDCIADPQHHRIILVTSGSDGTPLRSLSALRDMMVTRKVAFAMNAGMFDDAGRPIGLYVENGSVRHTLNRKAGPGNFHMLPNGVFVVSPKGWAVATSDAFLRSGASQSLDYATQSGPMLVVDGRLHPSISDDGPSRNIRNAVGVDPQGRAHFVISEDAVSFGKLARLYRDQLHCTNALYLDGFVSSLWDAAADRLDGGPPLGPLLVVEQAS